MAQAARLSLRLQKELKLLLTDPPHGSSFPSLSSSSSSSLSSLDVDLEGPEGTVYAKGIFKLKIQLPDRYPFQPPIVTFATPIYHPNIDNGGRICLDILNLPPKGAWQPSLNISTVLTSIGLLLSEPNPDDGLMHEVSKEYMYNRQAFDQKARSMTDKYAKLIIPSENANVDEIPQSLSIPTSVPIEKTDTDMSKCETSNSFTNIRQKKLGLSGRRLNLGASDNKENLVISEPGKKEMIYTTNVSYKKLRGITCKQPLKPVEHLQSNDEKCIVRMSQEEEESPVSENIVVLDSEESEGESNVSDRCKFLLTRKRLLEKRKHKI